MFYDENSYIERPTKTTKRVALINEVLKKLDADILILTETNEVIFPGEGYNYFCTEPLTESFYKEGERRTSIYSKYPVIKSFETFRNDTSICIQLSTPFGNLSVYGTIIGIHGNKRNNFTADLARQLTDFERIAIEGSLCIAGDLNMSFGDNYYFTHEGRQKLNDSFEKLKLKNSTASIPENIDHIIISESILTDKEVKVEKWNLEKKLSDHIGVCITISAAIIVF